MTTEYIVTIEDRFDFLLNDYKRLFEYSGATPFQSPLWMGHIHKYLVPELNARQHTIVIRNRQGGTLQAVFPFVIQKAVLGIKIMQFADFGVSDYNAVVGNNTVLTELSRNRTVLEEFERIIRKVDLLLVRKVREDSFDISLFFPKMTRKTNENAAYHWERSDGMPAWEHQIFSKKFLKDLRRKERKFIRDHSPYEFRKVKSRDEIQSIMSGMKQLHDRRFEESLLQTDACYQFYVNYAIAAIKSIEADLFVLYLDNRMIACSFGLLKDNGFISTLVAAYIDDYPAYSLGHQIFYRICNSLVSDGKSHIDLSIGSYDYKNKFNVTETRLYNYSRAFSIRGNVVAAIYNHARPVKNILKKYVPHVR